MNAIAKISNFLTYLKRHVIKQSLLNLIFLRFRCKKIWIGHTGCGFSVCPDILPSHLNSNSAGVCYSAGVGDDISFDRELHKKFAFREILLFDPTPLTVDWISRQNLPSEFKFNPIGLAGKSGTENFYLSDTEHVSSASSSSMIANGNKWVSEERSVRIQVMSVEDIAKLNGHSFIDILKMDIEGSEFDVIKSFKELKELQFGQICVEFHQRFFPNRWQVLREAVRILSDSGYKCFFVNWNVMEFSFINTRYYKKLNKSLQYFNKK